MQKKVYKIQTEEYTNIEELSESDRHLVEVAREASVNAYAPYSGFKVGAALLLADDIIVKGNNQENADFTDGICAERCTLFFAHSAYPDQPVVALAVTAHNRKGLLPGPVQPCGSCRQVLIETESRYNRQIRIILDGAEKIMILDGADNLLPFAFKPDALG